MVHPSVAASLVGRVQKIAQTIQTNAPSVVSVSTLGTVSNGGAHSLSRDPACKGPDASACDTSLAELTLP